MLREAIEALDEDPMKSMYFYNNPQAKVKLLQDIIAFSIERADGLTNYAADMRMQEILNFLDVNFQQYTWPAHEVHFHTNFTQHISCPYCCLNEISTIIEKLIKEKFAS
jgi:hypothetical protein